MKNVIYSLFLSIALASCSETFNIQGSSNISSLDGTMLYLKALKNNDFKTLDSCDVVHGKFRFSGAIDSPCIANIFMDDESLLPIVIEKGDININLNDTKQTVEGTPLNEELFKFFNQYNQLKNQEAELVHQHDQAIMNGSNMIAVTNKLSEEAIRLSQKEDELVTNFITDNFDNVLGPGIFFMVTIGNKYPELTPWIEDIWSKATDKFKNDAYVKDYYEKAQENQRIMNGMQDVPTAEPSVPAPPQAPAPPTQSAPTPNELAK